MVKIYNNNNNIIIIIIIIIIINIIYKNDWPKKIKT